MHVSALMYTKPLFELQLNVCLYQPLLLLAAMHVGGQAAATAATQGPDRHTECFAQPSMEAVPQPMPASAVPTKVSCTANHYIHVHVHVTSYSVHHLPKTC